jgi:class 3 adenylate cyclase/TolB-like protein/Tfp pilus assembly protein PilF
MASNSDGGARKLAAIMFTDVKDFSKKMGENEIAAMGVLKVHDDAMREIIARHNGVVIKSLGDSFMVDFASAVNAVRCAIEAQERFHQYSQDKSEFEKIQIRIGIHLGDVITVGNDLYGDGVNIAARIEAITEANRICVSAEIYNQVKNKMPIRAYNMGSTDLKNIAEPVEVFELLLDSIPGLSEPSESAKQIPTRRKADLISSQEQDEANRVEAVKQKVDQQQEKEYAEHHARANEHYAKAEEYFRAGDLANAEEEIKEIYKIVQIHYEAQMLILQIEEQRAVRDEEERRRRVKEEKKRKEDDRKQRIQKCFDVALEYVAKEEYQEALNALQEVYTLEPNNEQAKRIEKQVQFAEEARLERQRAEALADEERGREETLRLERERAEELARATLQKAAARKVPEPKPKKTLYIGIAAVAVLLIVATVVFLLVQRSSKKPGTIAVLPFSTGQTEKSYLGGALSTFVADEVAKAQDMVVIAPASVHAFAANSSILQTQAATLGITHVVRGTVSLSGTTVTLQAQLVELGEGQTIWESSLQANVLDLNNLAVQTSTALLKSFNIEVAPQNLTRPTENADAFDQYLRGLDLSALSTGEAVNQSIALLQDALRQDSTLIPAKAALAEALLEQYRRQGERDELTLAAAMSLAQDALKANPRTPSAHTVLAEVYRHKQQFIKARHEITASLALQPGNAQCLRELALLSLIQGKADEALQNAETALKLDPEHYQSHVVKGIVQLFKEQYGNAAGLFDKASALGAPDSLLTVNYKFRAWLGLDQEDKIIAYCQQMMERADDRTKIILHYWIGRGYSLKGKHIESAANFDQGIQLAERLNLLDPKENTSLAYYALLLARSGKSKLAVSAIERGVALDSTSARLHYWKARVHAVQNDKANALRELTKAVAREYNFLEILDPDFLSVWQDPQFKSTIVR